MKKCHSVYSFPKEQKTLIEIDSDEKSMYHSETKEETMEWRTLVVGSKESGKSTLICGLLVQNKKKIKKNHYNFAGKGSGFASSGKQRGL